MTLTLRPARLAELASISALALRSKGHWGYDADFLAACRDELTVTPERLARELITVAVAADGGGVLGFSSVVVDGAGADLHDLFVDPDHIGAGVGRALWDRAVAVASAAGARWLHIEADPHAAPWYRQRGAVDIGTAPSGSIPGRQLPLLRLTLPGGATSPLWSRPGLPT